MAIRVLINTEFVNTKDPRSDVWWDAAVDTRDTAPEPLKRVFAGADAVDVSEDEARQIREWASKFTGWADRPDGEKPLLFQVAGTARFDKTE